MWKRTIVLPTADNDGRSLAPEIAAIELEILGIAGGFTVTQTSGVWVDAGKVFRDESRTYTIVTDSTSDTELAERLPAWTSRLRQLALYTDSASVDVTFVQPAATVAA